MAVRRHRLVRAPGLEDGAPLGLDARAIVRTDLSPAVHTGIAHREGWPGQIGAGTSEVPLAALRDAVTALEAAQAAPGLAS